MKTKHDLEQLHNFIELMSDLVFVKNIKGEYTHVNNAFLKFVNKKRKDVLLKLIMIYLMNKLPLTLEKMIMKY